MVAPLLVAVDEDLGVGVRREAVAAPLRQAFNTVCLPLTWSTIEPAQGDYRWQPHDQLLDWAITAKALRPPPYEHRPLSEESRVRQRYVDLIVRPQARRNAMYYGSMAVTFLLGATFVAIELHEFATMIHAGAGPGRSAFLSAFFALIGCHGLHVSAGLLWLLTMMAQVYAKGYRADIRRRLLCFALFWHTLDIIWVALFTVVYLMGVSP
jgi:hypothetical protein